MYETLVSYASKQLELDATEITRESTFESLGIDSLDVVEMIMELESDLGLSSYLAQGAELKDVVFQTGHANLYMLPSGPVPVDPSGLIGSNRMQQLLTEVSKRFDVVLVDSPPVLGVSDASLLVSRADATLLVLQPRKMPIKALLRSKSLIQSAGGNIMGLVMNNVDISGDTQYQYYTTYYSYYSKGNNRVEPKAVAVKTDAEPTPDTDSNDLY